MPWWGWLVIMPVATVCLVVLIASIHLAPYIRDKLEDQ